MIEVHLMATIRTTTCQQQGQAFQPLPQGS